MLALFLALPFGIGFLCAFVIVCYVLVFSGFALDFRVGSFDRFFGGFGFREALANAGCWRQGCIVCAIFVQMALVNILLDFICWLVVLILC